MIVGHWLLYNQGDHDWLVDRFMRQREAIALHKERIRDTTGGAAMSPPLTVADDVKSRENALRDEFGKEAQRDWWDSGGKAAEKANRSGFENSSTRLRTRRLKRKCSTRASQGVRKPSSGCLTRSRTSG